MCVQVGILGFAHGHVNSYCDEWRAHPELGVTVEAGWDHDEARLQRAVELLGLESYHDVDELLSNRKIQAVVIASETSRHADLVERAAAAGKAIVLQKPIAITMGEAQRIVNAVEQANVPFTMAWQMRVDPQNLAMK